MVTINPDKPIQPTASTKKSDSPAKPPQGGFDAVFNQVAAQRPTASAPTGTEKTVFVPDVHPARFADGRESASGDVVNGVQGLIDTLAGYQKQLGDHGATLKDLHGIVGRMASQSEALGTAANGLAGDEKLERIVNEALQLSSLEIARYYDGHYGE